MTSVFVKQEWEYALKLNREKFIRPVYWEEPLPKSPPDLPPPALSRLHFYQFTNPEDLRPGVVPPEIEEHRHEDARKSWRRGFNRNWFLSGGPMMKALAYTSFALIASIVFMPFVSHNLQGLYPTATPEPTPIGSPYPSPQSTLSSTPSLSPKSSPVGTPNTTPTPAPSSSPVATPTSEPTPSPNTIPTPKPTATTKPTPTPNPTPTPRPTPTPEVSSEVRVGIKPSEFDGRKADSSYRIVVSNVGSDVISAVEIRESLPRQFDYVGSVPAAKRQGQVLTWRIDKIEANRTGAVSVRVKRTPSIAQDKVVTLRHHLIVSYVDSNGKHHVNRP